VSIQGNSGNKEFPSVLLHLLFPFADDFIIFNLFRYLTFRTIGALLTALVISFLIGPWMIKTLRLHQNGGQPIRDFVPSHQSKSGTPTMGGLMILIGIILGTILWADLWNQYVWNVLMVTTSFGFIGLYDDYLKVVNRSSSGLPGHRKLLWQTVIGAASATWYILITPEPIATGIAVPFFKGVLIPISWGIIPFAAFVIVGSSNAVNLTDGLDGLAIVPVMIAAACFR
jgi:phospho-N-acetylmuramoyl-pentapeptide-transferase